MGVLRRTRQRPRAVRPVAAAGLAALAAVTVAGCRPGDLNSASAAYTTDRTATARLDRQHVDVRWLSCTGDYGSGGRTQASGRSPSPSESTVVSVDCQGRTEDGRKITVTGRVTRAVDGACVRGDLVARVGGKERFHVHGLGDCDATPGPAYSPPATHRPPAGGQPRPTVTVTVTRTIWCETDPSCRPVEGK
ncbi:hypothetical protein [Streptomyces sp. V3I7]|uniref:hypothetical protein n=1 Tax=Streptomyces sp. V3I7 TaxID=3042278 RepID=UPI00277D92E6|nr:hypothetical protein [Streptomyces sp. V3I7]MDQ0990850.1 hypothetical protein [Streptomyces sp. V3I7]